MLNCRVGQTGFFKNLLMMSLSPLIVKSLEKTYPLVKLTSPLSRTIDTTIKHKKCWMLDEGWQKSGSFVGARKLNLKFPVKIFICFCCLTTTRQPTPTIPSTYSYLPFKVVLW